MGWWVGGGVCLEVFCQMGVIVEALLTNGAAVASWCFVLLVDMLTDVMVLEVLPSVKASVAHSTRKATRLTMNGLTMPLQRFLGSEHLGAKVAHDPLAVALGRREGGGVGAKSTVASIEQAAEWASNSAF